MISNEAQLVIEVWDYVKEFMPAKRRQEIAASILKSFENYGFDPSDMKDIMYEEDEAVLAKAYQELYEYEIEEEDEFIDDEEGW